MLAEVSFQKEGNSAWGFRLTGGPQFGMPLTVFEVEEGGRAYRAGIRLGDVLVRINGMDADRLSLDDAHNMISAAGNNINLSISNLEDQELRESEEFAKAVAGHLTDAEDTDTELSREAEVQHSEGSELDISEVQHSEASAASEAPRTETSLDDTSGHVRSEQSEEGSMSKVCKSDEVKKSEGAGAGAAEEPQEEYVDVRTLPLLPPRPAPEPERAQRRCWHPVMLDTNPPPIIEESTGDERAQLRKHYQEVKTSFTVRLSEDNPKTPPAEKTSEPDLAVTLQLRTMQRQLQQLVQLPAAIQATLQAVSSHLDNLLPAPTAAHHPPHRTSHTVLVQSDDSGEFLEEDYSDSFEEALSEEEETWSELDMEALRGRRTASQSDSAPSPPPTPTGDELEKTAKLQKMETLNKCWPWADAAKPIYKIAEHYEPVYGRCINNKVKWLEEKISEDQILAKNLKGI